MPLRFVSVFGLFLFQALCWTVPAFFTTLFTMLFYFPCGVGNITFSNAWLILVLVSVYAGSEWSNSHPEFSEMLCQYFEFKMMFEGIGPAHLFRVEPVGSVVLNP